MEYLPATVPLTHMGFGTPASSNAAALMPKISKSPLIPMNFHLHHLQK